MSLTHQTRSAFVVRPLFLGHHQGPDLFFYFFSFSGQGCTGNYKSIEAWPGLYNLCGICVLLCESSLREWPPLSVLLWRLFFFLFCFLFPANHFLWENLAVKECSTCTSVLENLTKADHQLFLPKNISLYPRSLDACSYFWTLSRLLLKAGPHPAQSHVLSLHKHHSALFVYFLYPRCTALFLWGGG